VLTADGQSVSTIYADRNDDHQSHDDTTRLAFEYSWEKRAQEGDNSIPTINVAEAFTGGGAQIGLSFNQSNTWSFRITRPLLPERIPLHSLKFGVRLRGVDINDRSENNFAGTFSFPGAAAVRTCTTDDPPVCTVISPAISPLEQYQGTHPGESGSTVIFPINSGSRRSARTDVSRFDVGLFATDDWRVSPGLTLSFGMRYRKSKPTSVTT
jgi:outer membrane receptor protein involved in Fe transport